MGDRFRVSGASIPDCNERVITIGTIDVINLKTVDEARTQAASKPWHSESTPPTSLSMKDIEQSKHEHPTEKQAEREGKHPPL
jgi:hypothetical protein